MPGVYGGANEVVALFRTRREREQSCIPCSSGRGVSVNSATSPVHPLFIPTVPAPVHLLISRTWREREQCYVPCSFPQFRLPFKTSALPTVAGLRFTLI